LLEVADLSCSRGDRPLFRNLSFRLEPGQLLHVQGPNGSGKTTLLRTLCGLSRPAAGEVRWRGRAVGEDRAAYVGAIAYVGHANALHGDLTGGENLDFEACLAGGGPVDAAVTLSNLGLGRVAGLPVKLLSQGQKRRTALARLPAGNKRLWILDEPLAALDARACADLLALFARHLDGGGLVVLTSHQEVQIEQWPVLTLSLEGL
jgi:heme exporter protein A